MVRKKSAPTVRAQGPNETGGVSSLRQLIVRESLRMSFDSLLDRPRELLLCIENQVTRKMKEEKVTQSRARLTLADIQRSLCGKPWELRHQLTRLVTMEFLVAHHNEQTGELEYELVFRSDDAFLGNDTSELVECPSLV